MVLDIWMPQILVEQDYVFEDILKELSLDKIILKYHRYKTQWLTNVSISFFGQVLKMYLQVFLIMPHRGPWQRESSLVNDFFIEVYLAHSVALV